MFSGFSRILFRIYLHKPFYYRQYFGYFVHFVIRVKHFLGMTLFAGQMWPLYLKLKMRFLCRKNQCKLTIFQLGMVTVICILIYILVYLYVYMYTYIYVYLNNSYKRLSVNEVTLMMLLVNWLPLFLNWNRLGSADAACYSRQRPLAS